MDTKQELSFEQALEELETLVGKMETGRLPLEELISGFERGNRLAAFCRKKLDTLERRIEVLTRDDGKNGEWSDFHPGTNRQARPAPEEPQAADDGGLF